MRQHMELGRRALVKDFYATLGKKKDLTSCIRGRWVCSPSIFSLNTCIYPMGVTLTHRSHVAPLEPLLGLVSLRALGGLVCGALSAYVVHFRVSSLLLFFFF